MPKGNPSVSLVTLAPRAMTSPIFEPVNPTNQEPKTDPIRILLVEDDDDYREIVSSELSWHGFDVRSFADGDSLLGSLDITADADVIVLDWRLPNISGIDLLPQLRERGVNLPVVFLTSHPEPVYEKLAFERGALDFIDIVCGKLVLRRNIYRALWNEVDVGLTVSEYDIVDLLASNVGRYQAYRAIYDLQYYEGFVAGQGNHGYRTNVRSSIKRIRKKFCKLDPTFAEIQNSITLGYRWRGLTVPAESGVPVARHTEIP
jgi:two-component system response regulator ChvI